MSFMIALPAVLTASTVKTSLAQLQQSMRTQPHGVALVLDASRVQSFDSAGLALLLDCRRFAQKHQQSLQVQGWTSSLLALAQVYGVLPLLDPAANAPQAE